MASKKQSSVLGQCSVNDTYMPTIQQGGTHSRSPTASQMSLNYPKSNAPPPVPKVQLILDNLFSRVDGIDGLKGLGVVFAQEDSEKPVFLIMREPTYEKQDYIVFHMSRESKENESKLGDETLDFFLNCGSAGLGILAIGATQGSALIVLGVTTAASSLQCGNSIGRVANEVFSPGSNDVLDQQQWYKGTKFVLDAVGFFDFAKGVFTIFKSIPKLIVAFKVVKGKAIIDPKNFSVTIKTTASNRAVKKAVQSGDVPIPIKDNILKKDNIQNFSKQSASTRNSQIESILSKNATELSRDAISVGLGAKGAIEFFVEKISVTNLKP